MRRLLDLPLLVILTGLAAVAMLVPAAHAVASREYAVARAFLYSAILVAVLAALIATAVWNRSPRAATRNHLNALLAAYLVLPPIFALPFAQAVPDTTYLNAWFEMVSCFTTTGASLYDAPGRVVGSIHLWRALVGWLGGFFILLAAAAILAPLNLGGFEVIEGGAVGHGRVRAGRGAVGEAGERIRRYAALLLPVYAGLTLALWIGLLMAGDPALVAVCHAMSTLATSGISPVGGLKGSESGVAGELLIFFFLFFAISRHTLPGTAAYGGRAGLVRDPEFRLGLVIVGTLTLILFLRHWLGARAEGAPDDPGSALAALWAGAFTVMSFLSTTGFVAESWHTAEGWSGLTVPGLMLVGLALLGGGVATTAGGVKLLRAYALYKHGQRELERLVHPSSVGGAGAVARRLRREGAFVAWIFFMLFGLTLMILMAALTLAGLRFEPALIFAVAALSTTGPLADVATSQPLAYTDLGALAKMILAAAMVLGRLETLALIALFTPDSWRN